MGVDLLTAFLDFPAVDAERGIPFWTNATGYRPSAARGRSGEFRTLVPPHGDARLRVQTTGDSRSRVHLDLHSRDVAGLVETVHAVGAVALPPGSADVRGPADATDGARFRSPAGVVFCVVASLGEPVPPPPLRLPDGTRSVVDQVCLDIPAARFADEVAFWREITAWTWSDGGSPEFQRLDRPASMRILLQRTDEPPDESGNARAHLDLACDDRDAEAARHLALGAELLYPGRGWVTLRDPTGLVYCCTGRVP